MVRQQIWMMRRALGSAWATVAAVAVTFTLTDGSNVTMGYEPRSDLVNSRAAARARNYAPDRYQDHSQWVNSHCGSCQWPSKTRDLPVSLL